MKLSFRTHSSLYPTHTYTDIIPFDQHDYSFYDVLIGDKVVGTTPGQNRAKVVIKFFKYGFRGYKVKELMTFLGKDITIDELLDDGNMVL